MFNPLSLFRRKPDTRAAMAYAMASRQALLLLERRLLALGDAQAIDLGKALHECLAVTADEVGRVMQVDVAPLSGGGAKNL